MFEKINEAETGHNRLSQKEKEAVVAAVVSQFQAYHAVRQSQVDMYNRLKKEIYLTDTTLLDKPEDAGTWKSAVRFHKLYALFQTRQAFLWDNIFSDLNQMFDVVGIDETSHQTAVLQKKALVEAFHQMKITPVLDKALEYLDVTGEMCFFVSWKKRTKQIRRYKGACSPETGAGQPPLKLVRDGRHFGVYEQVIYEGVAVDAVHPLSLVFAPDVCPEIQDSWDKGAKIIKTFETPDKLCANQLLTVSDADQRFLKRLCQGKVTSETPADEADLIQEVVQDGKIEVLHYWGDFVMPDGQVLHNWCMTVIGRKILACFQENPYVINPLINVALTRHIETKRGVPALYSVYDLCLYQEKKANLENDSQALALNPPRFAPEGFFKKSATVFAPGAVLEYKRGLEDPNSIVPINVPLVRNNQILAYLDHTISAVSGIYPNMQGAEEMGRMTATEIKVKLSGQTTRIAKDLDTIKQNGLVALVEKVAELAANMKYGDEELVVTGEAKPVRMCITDAVRNGRYTYRYTDNTGIQAKLNVNQQLMQILSPVWNDADIALNKAEIVKVGLENAGIEHPEKYIVPAGEIAGAQAGRV